MLDELISAYTSMFYIVDLAPFLVVLGAVVGNLLAGDPLWLLVVGPPSSGKSEIVVALGNMQFVHEVSDCTLAGLLTGRKKDGAVHMGGVLAAFEPRGGHRSFGILSFKDLSGFLAEDAKVRRSLVGALREIFDGSYVRELGTGGGLHLRWAGKTGFVGAVTEQIDLHAGMLASMGHRFICVRMPALNGQQRLAQCDRALANVGRQAGQRNELAERVHDTLAGVDLKMTPPGHDTRLPSLADLVTRCRSVVDYEGFEHVVALVPEAEQASRYGGVLAQLDRGLAVLGLPAGQRWELLLRVGLDSIYKHRRQLIELVMGAPGARWDAKSLGDRLGLPAVRVERDLTDLVAQQVIERQSGDRDVFYPSGWLTERWQQVGLLASGADAKNDPNPGSDVESETNRWRKDNWW